MLNMKFKFTDLTGTCFRDFGNLPANNNYHKALTHVLNTKKSFSTCSMMIIRNELIREGAEYGVDFTVENAQVPMKV